MTKLKLPVCGVIAALAIILAPSGTLAQLGPSILSRGGERPGQRGGQPVNFNFFAGASGTAESGITPTGTDANGALITHNLYGIQGELGAYGTHQFKRSSVGLDYRGDYRHNSHGTLDGSQQALSLEYLYEPTRRFSITAMETAGISSRAFGGLIGSTLPTDALFGIPTNQVFDNRTYYLQSSLSAGYRKSARTSFTVSGDYFTVGRQSKALVGANGERVGAEYRYQFDRNSSIGVGYNFIHMGFPRIFGASDIHSVQVRYSRQLARRIMLEVDGGVYRVESLATSVVTLSPEVAAILGVGSSIAAVYKVNKLPQFSATLSYARQRQAYHVGYTQGVTPGNGLYLTSQQRSANGGYSYSGIRKMSIGLNAGFTQYNSLLVQQLSRYNSGQAGLGLSYVLGHHLNFVAQADVRTFSTAGGKRTGYDGSIGLRYSPAEVPLPIW